MDATLFEQLLHEDEGSTLDVKRDQYPFARASEAEKSEIAKDILGFANAWYRRADAYILIGVREIRGGRSIVMGVDEHLDDHSLQQFMLHLTNRPARFHYEVFPFEQKQIGIIRIDKDQPRPLHLTRDFGPLRRGLVYVRRGSSTDPSKPASPDELVQMGRAEAAVTRSPTLAVQFADEKRRLLGTELQWRATHVRVKDSKSIPDLRRRRSNPFGIDTEVFEGKTNEDFYRQFARYLFVRTLCKEVRFALTNEGSEQGVDVRVELFVPDSVIVVADLPDKPRRGAAGLGQYLDPGSFRSIHTASGDVRIESAAGGSTVIIEFLNIQPGLTVITEPIHIGIRDDQKKQFVGHIFAANLEQRREFSLHVSADVRQQVLTADQLVAIAEADHSDD